MPVEGNLTYGSGNVLSIELGGVLDGEFDRLDVGGDVTLDGMLAASLVLPFVPQMGDQFEILDVGGALTGQFIGLGEGTLIDLGIGAPLRLSYMGGDGNNVVLSTVPTPSVGGVIAAGLVLLGGRCIGRAARRPG